MHKTTVAADEKPKPVRYGYDPDQIDADAVKK